jgi:hypothetical protein
MAGGQLSEGRILQDFTDFFWGIKAADAGTRAFFQEP